MNVQDAGMLSGLRWWQKILCFARSAGRGLETMKYNKTCACCGKEFISDRKNGRFCSTYCRNIIKSKEEAERYRRKKAEAEITAEIAEVKETLAETVQKARDMGMSYGQYKAMIYKKMKGV